MSFMQLPCSLGFLVADIVSIVLIPLLIENALA